MYTSIATYENKPDTINFGVNTDHLGNIRALVSDKRIMGSNNNLEASLLGYNDYYPYGMLQPGRSFNAGDYRYLFNGMEQEQEIAGVGNSYTAEFWQYDPRIGRRWNTDPIFKPWESRYACFSNNPILYNDPQGLDPQKRAEKYAKKQEITNYRLYKDINTGTVWLRYSYTDKSAEKASVIAYKAFKYNILEKVGHVIRRIVNRSKGNDYGPNKKHDATKLEEILIKTFDQDKVKEMGETYGDSKIGGTNRNTVETDVSYEGEREEKEEKKKKESGNTIKVTLESDVKEKVNEQNRLVHGKPLLWIPENLKDSTKLEGGDYYRKGDTLELDTSIKKRWFYKKYTSKKKK